MKAVVAAALALAAHVGSPTVFYEGPAGPYAVRVIIRPPGVVPGLADIAVWIQTPGVQRVTVQAARWDLGLEGAPRPDDARPVPGDAGWYSAQLWLMTGGSYSVHVAIQGDRGDGSVVIPVASVATRRLEMSRPLGIALLGLGVFLLAGAVTIFGAAASESVLPPGEQPDAGRRRRGRRARVMGGALLVLALLGGKAWWDNMDAAYVANLFEPLHITTSTRPAGDQVRLRIAVDDPVWLERRITRFIPDHGKLMHLFLIRADLGALAHLHPIPVDSSTFESTLPPLPAGRWRYWIYADVVHESGFAQTLVDTLELAGSPAGRGAVKLADADDSWHVAEGTSTGERGRAATSVALGNRWTMSWQRDAPPAAGRETTLRFFIADRDGTPAELEPFMGMAGHAAVVRDDGSVFVHLHPLGTVSVAAQAVLLRRDSLAAPIHASHVEPPGTVGFPYEFPRSGHYRVWVQVKLRGQVQTGVFDVEVP